MVVQDEVSDELPVTSRVHVGGLCCHSEVAIVSSALGSLPGVIKVGTSCVKGVCLADVCFAISLIEEPLLQVECVVPTKTVFVQHHAGLTSPALLVAALNGARLDAALAPPRSAGMSKVQWLPPWHGEPGGCAVLCICSIAACYIILCSLCICPVAACHMILMSPEHKVSPLQRYIEQAAAVQHSFTGDIGHRTSGLCQVL